MTNQTPITISDILDSLAVDDYKIATESNCGCSIDWCITQGDLYAEVSGDECWIGNILYVLNPATQKYAPVVENLAYEPMRTTSTDITIDALREALEEEGLEHIMDELSFDEDHEENDSHANKMRATLEEFVTESGYDCYIYYPRGFSNEYDCILVSPDADDSDLPDDANHVTAADFAEAYLEKGDDATTCYKGFKLIE